MYCLLSLGTILLLFSNQQSVLILVVIAILQSVKQFHMLIEIPISKTYILTLKYDVT